MNFFTFFLTGYSPESHFATVFASVLNKSGSPL
jgi:hypothetical protein